MHSFLQFLSQTLLHNNNQFAAGGLVLMAIGSVGAALRKLPLRLWDWFLGQTTLHATILDSRDAFDWFKWWFIQQSYSKRSRRIDVDDPLGCSTASFAPAPGRHWFWYRGRPVKIVLERENSKEASAKERKEQVVLSTIGRNQKFMRRLIDDMQRAYETKRGTRPRLFTWVPGSNYWSERYNYEPRPLHSVVLPEQIKTGLMQDIKTFLKSEEWYRSVGIPYHRGYLLYGPPGTGKTSLIAAVSRELNARVHFLRLNEMNDKALNEAMRQIPRGAMVVMEDIDCVKATAQRKEEKGNGEEETLFGVTLSGLLNALDGVYAPDGAMYFMTTNHINDLDAALIRPGRIDLRVHLEPAKEEQMIEMYCRFFPNRSKSAAQKFITESGLADGCAMAEFQNRLLQLRAA